MPDSEFNPDGQPQDHALVNSGGVPDVMVDGETHNQPGAQEDNYGSLPDGPVDPVSSTFHGDVIRPQIPMSEADADQNLVLPTTPSFAEGINSGEHMADAVGVVEPLDEVITEGQDLGATAAVIPTSETSTADGRDDIAPAEIESPDQGGWDNEKAAIMATVLKEDGGFDEAVRSRDDAKKRIENEDPPHKTDETLVTDLAQRQAEVQGYVDRDVPVPVELEAQVAWLSEQIEVDKKITDRFNELHREHVVDIVDSTVDRVLEAYLALYDINPDKFSNMTPKEFMALAAEVQVPVKEVSLFEDNIDTIGFLIGDLKGSIEDGQVISDDNLRQLIADLKHTSGVEPGSEESRDLDERFHSISHNSLDLTLRQVMEGYIALVEEYKLRADTRLEESRQKLQAALEQHRAEATPVGGSY